MHVNNSLADVVGKCAFVGVAEGHEVSGNIGERDEGGVHIAWDKQEQTDPEARKLGAQ